MDYNKAEYQQSTLEDYQLHFTKHYFKASFEDSLA